MKTQGPEMDSAYWISQQPEVLWRSASHLRKYKNSKIAIFTKKCMAGGQYVPACHTFPCKSNEFHIFL